MNCPKCGSDSCYRFEGAYHCKRCEYHFTDWQQAEISRLTIENVILKDGSMVSDLVNTNKELREEVKELEAISRIDRSLLDAAKIYTDSLTAEVKAKDAEIDKYGCTPEQYHGALTMLWNALGNPKMDGRLVFQRVVDEIATLKAQVGAAQACVDALMIVLPMAKGYAFKSDVLPNVDKVRSADMALESYRAALKEVGE